MDHFAHYQHVVLVLYDLKIVVVGRRHHRWSRTSVVVSIPDDSLSLDTSSVSLTTADADVATADAQAERGWMEVPVLFESADADVTANAPEQDGDSGDASADAVMEQWDAEIWKEESAPLVTQADEQKDPSGRETIVRNGWLAGLAMLTPSLFRRRGNDRKEE